MALLSQAAQSGGDPNQLNQLLTLLGQQQQQGVVPPQQNAAPQSQPYQGYPPQAPAFNAPQTGFDPANPYGQPNTSQGYVQESAQPPQGYAKGSALPSQGYSKGSPQPAQVYGQVSVQPPQSYGQSAARPTQAYGQSSAQQPQMYGQGSAQPQQAYNHTSSQPAQTYGRASSQPTQPTQAYGQTPAHSQNFGNNARYSSGERVVSPNAAGYRNAPATPAPQQPQPPQFQQGYNIQPPPNSYFGLPQHPESQAYPKNEKKLDGQPPQTQQTGNQLQALAQMLMKQQRQ